MLSFPALSNFAAAYLPRVEQTMRKALASPQLAEGTHYAMMRYHLGWLDEEFRPAQANMGKGIRPLLCLLSCAAVGGDPATVLSAAAALEMLHNFSLVHDDVEDNSPTRRHRPTVWALWGQPQAINVGDALFAHAFRTLLDLAPAAAPDQVIDAMQRFVHACIALTEGQHLDMDFETRANVTTDEYLLMIRGKTAALLAASVEIGASLGGAQPAQLAALRQFGESLGLAFQIQDDILGIWGDEQMTGKSAASDILARKKSLPVLYALNGTQGAALRELYAHARFTADEVPAVLDRLAAAGARPYAASLVETYSMAALQALHEADLVLPAGDLLRDLALGLLDRQT
jgi:geranylgeranyl diphosphate synthase type I